MDNFYLKRKFLQKSIKDNLNDSSLFEELSKPFEYDVKYSFQYDANIFNNKKPVETKEIINKKDKEPAITDKNRLNLGCDKFGSYEKLGISIDDDNFNFVNESTKINLPKKEALPIFKNKFKRKENETNEMKKNSEKNTSTLNSNRSNRIDFATSFTEFGGSKKKLINFIINSFVLIY